MIFFILIHLLVNVSVNQISINLNLSNGIEKNICIKIISKTKNDSRSWVLKPDCAN